MKDNIYIFLTFQVKIFSGSRRSIGIHYPIKNGSQIWCKLKTISAITAKAVEVTNTITLISLIFLKFFERLQLCIYYWPTICIYYHNKCPQYWIYFLGNRTTSFEISFEISHKNHSLKIQQYHNRLFDCEDRLSLSIKYVLNIYWYNRLVLL